MQNTFKFFRLLVIVNGFVPLLCLLWDAWRHQLGANSVNQALHITGILSLVFLLLHFRQKAKALSERNVLLRTLGGGAASDSF